MVGQVTAVPCPVCLADTRDGLLCATCTATLRAALRSLPDLMRELRVTLTRQNQGARSGGRGNGDTPLPFNVNASEVFYSVTHTVGTWIRDIDGNADPGRTMSEWCTWLLTHMPAIRRHIQVVQLYDELTYSIKIVRQAIDRTPDREYVQPCAICGHGVYATPGADTAACGECRRVAERDTDGNITGYVPEYDVQAAHVTRVAALRCALLTTTELCTAVEAIRGEPLSIKTIRSWINRGRLVSKGFSNGPDATALYAVEDALALAAQIPTPARRRAVRRVSA